MWLWYQESSWDYDQIPELAKNMMAHYSNERDKEVTVKMSNFLVIKEDVHDSSSED